MKLAAAKAIAAIAKMPVPEVVNDVYKVNNLTFGRDYFIPKPIDPRLITEVSCAVAKAAMDSGIAREPITDWVEYRKRLREMAGQETKLTQRIYDMARKHPQRVVFAEGKHPTMLKAAVQAKAEGICEPVLLGNEEMIAKLAEELDLNIEGIEIVNLRHDRERERRERYAEILANKRSREGYTFDEANDKMFERNYFGMMMVETGEADAFITGLYTRYSNTVKVAKEVVGIKEGFSDFATMHILNTKKGILYICDTMINSDPRTDDLVQIARLAERTVKFFNDEPRMAMISYSNFGSDNAPGSRKVHEAVKVLHEQYPDLTVDGEMQIGYALDREKRDAKWPFSKLCGKDANTLIFPNLTSARSSYKMIQALEMDAEIIGPIQMGLKKPIHFIDFECSIREILNVTAVAALDAYAHKKK